MSQPDRIESSAATTERRFKSPGDALVWPKVVVRWLVRFRERLGLPEPDEHWETTHQVRWHENPAPFFVRAWCLYAGHDMQRVRVRDGYCGSRLDCQRCGWEGPWV